MLPYRIFNFLLGIDIAIIFIVIGFRTLNRCKLFPVGLRHTPFPNKDIVIFPNGIEKIVIWRNLCGRGKWGHIPVEIQIQHIFFKIIRIIHLFRCIRYIRLCLCRSGVSSHWSRFPQLFGLLGLRRDRRWGLAPWYIRIFCLLRNSIAQ